MQNCLSHLGGKPLLARKIIPRRPPSKYYGDVFAGASWMLFKKEEAQIEILNA